MPRQCVKPSASLLIVVPLTWCRADDDAAIVAAPRKRHKADHTVDDKTGGAAAKRSQPSTSTSTSGSEDDGHDTVMQSEPDGAAAADGDDDDTDGDGDDDDGDGDWRKELRQRTVIIHAKTRLPRGGGKAAATHLYPGERRSVSYKLTDAFEYLESQRSWVIWVEKRYAWRVGCAPSWLCACLGREFLWAWPPPLL